MADVNVGFSGDGSPIKRAWEVSAEGVQAFINEVKKINSASNAAESAQRELGSTANRWLKAMETPLDAHLRRMGELQTILQAGTISQHEYSKGIAISVAEMRQAEEAADTLGQTAKRVLAEQQSPQDQYNAKLALYSELRKANKINEEQFAIAATRAKQALDSQDASLQSLLKDGEKLRAGLVTAQDEYNSRVQRANQLLNAGIISEGDYAAEVDKAEQALRDKDSALQQMLSRAEKIKASAVTPEQAHAKAIAESKQLLDKKLITQKEYDLELARQNKLLDQSVMGTNRLGEAAEGLSSQFMSELTGIGTLMGVVGGAAALFHKELESLREAQKTAAEKQLDLAASQRAAVLSLGDDPTMSPERLHEEVKRISAKNKVPMKQVYDVVGNALSAKSALTPDEAVSAADIGTRVTPFSGATEIAGSVLDMKNRYGGTHAQMMGVNLGTQQASRVKDAATFAKNVVPTIVNLGGFQNEVEQSAALVATLSTAMTDLEGRSSATAAEQLAEQLKKELPNQKNTISAIQYLQSKEGERDRDRLFGNAKKKIKPKLSFEMGAWNSMRELVSADDTPTKRAYEAAVAAIPKLGDSEAYYNNAMARVERQPLQQQSVRDRALKVAAEQASLNDLEGGKAAIAREGLDAALKQSGEGFMSRWWTARKLDYADFAGFETPQEFASRTLRDKAKSLRAGKNYEGNVIAPTADELKTAASLDAVGADLNGLNQPAKPTGVPDPRQRPKNFVDGSSAPEGTLPVATAAPAAPVVELGPESRAALRENTEATKANTAKPPVVVRKPINQPTKIPASAAVQNAK